MSSATKVQVGQRVRHSGQRYPEAAHGTATVLEVAPQQDGTSEVTVLVDAEHNHYGEGPRETSWASYHTVPCTPPPASG